MDGIETARKVYSIGSVAESRLSKYRLRCMQTREDTSGLRENDLLEEAEKKLFDAIQLYVKRGGNRELVLRVVNLEFEVLQKLASAATSERKETE